MEERKSLGPFIWTMFVIGMLLIALWLLAAVTQAANGQYETLASWPIFGSMFVGLCLLVYTRRHPLQGWKKSMTLVIWGWISLGVAYTYFHQKNDAKIATVIQIFNLALIFSDSEDQKGSRRRRRIWKKANVPLN